MDSIKERLSHALQEVGQLHPNWRYGQVVANVAAWAGADEPADVWNVSDEELLRAALEHLRSQAARSAIR
jgi:hypothetical protein